MLGIRNQIGQLQIELNGETILSITVQTKTNLNNAWLDWTNVTGSDALQPLPLKGLTNRPFRHFRAFSQ